MCSAGLFCSGVIVLSVLSVLFSVVCVCLQLCVVVLWLVLFVVCVRFVVVLVVCWYYVLVRCVACVWCDDL